MKSGIYKILNTHNGKLYIGSAVDLGNRKSTHFTHLKRKIHKNVYLQNAFNKYGENVFEFGVLEIVKDRSLLTQKEQLWLDWSQSYDREKGYNLCSVAGSQLGVKWTEESRKRQSVIQTGKRMAPEAIAKTVAGNTGKKRNSEQRARMSAAQKGKKQSPEHIAKLAALRRGRPRSEASRQKLRETIARKKLSIEAIYV